MKRRFVLAPEAARDLVNIWRYIRKRTSITAADRIEDEIRERILFLARNPGAGHWRKDLTSEPLRFLAIYSYLIVYWPDSKPLQVVAILHGNRDVDQLLADRLQ